MNAVVFWQNVPSVHQVGLMRSVAARRDGEVIVVTESDVPPHRQRLGWTRPDFSPAQLIVAPIEFERAKLVKRYGRAGVVHIFTGLSGFPSIYRTLKAVSRTEATIGAYLEPGRQDDGLRAVARRLLYTMHGVVWRRRLDFILATGALAERYYISCGFPWRKIFPFGYFVEPFRVKENLLSVDEQKDSRERAVRMVFVGELVKHKGLDILLRALHQLLHLPWRLDVVGGGSDDGRLRDMSASLGLETRIGWLGVMTNEMAREKMRLADALVLPSRHDGWGAVVNEALLAGTRVVASDACGASELLYEPWRGHVFRAGSVSDLHGVLDTLIRAGQLSSLSRARIREWAEHVLAPDAASGYLLEVIEHVLGGCTPRPNAPWRASEHSGK